MSGILETLEGKMDTLIAVLSENNKLRAAENAAGGAAGTTTTTEEPKKTRATKAKVDETPVNKIDEATLVAKFDELKAVGGDMMPKLKKIIADVGGVASLAELRQLPAKFDAVYEALTALQAPAEDDDL